MSPQSHRRNGDRVDGQVNCQNNCTLGPGRDYEGRSSRSGVDQCRSLVDQAQARELADQPGNGGAVEPGGGGQLGAGNSSEQVKAFQHNTEVVTAELVGCEPHAPVARVPADGDFGWVHDCQEVFVGEPTI